jgi:hypothetical protein
MTTRSSPRKTVLLIATGIIVIATYSFATAVFGAYLDWYDTGRFDGDSVIPGYIGGAIAGLAAFLAETAVHRRWGIWPGNFILFYLRQVVGSTLTICVGFMVIGCLYLPLAAPFGLVAAVPITVALRVTWFFYARR